MGNNHKKSKKILNSHSSSNLKIIIVEDNDINAELLSIQLGDLGYATEIAVNGKIFLQMITEKHYDLILMDCQMPIMDGYDATKQFRKNEKSGSHVPIIAVTANTMPGEREKCLDCGMDDYIGKPVQLNTLNEKVNHWIMNQ